MGQLSSLPKETRLGLTMCSYETHYLGRTRLNDDDLCAHPWCAKAVALRWRGKAEQLEKELEEIKKRHEDTSKRLIARISSGAHLAASAQPPDAP